MEAFLIIISIIGVLSLVWIAAILTFIWAENSHLLKTFDHIDKTVKGLNADTNKKNDDIHKRWRDMIGNTEGIKYTQYPAFFYTDRMKYTTGLSETRKNSNQKSAPKTPKSKVQPPPPATKKRAPKKTARKK